MKKILFSALAALMLVACGNKSQVADASSDEAQDSTSVQSESGNHNKAGAKAAIENIYNIYFNPGGYANEEEEDESDISGFGFMTQFVSDEFNQIFCMAQSKQLSIDEVWLDCDPWIDAQDCEDLELVDVKIVKYADDKAVADVAFMNFGKEHTVGCVVVYDAEKGKWLVDDLVLPEVGSVKQMADDFCSGAYEE